VSQRAWERLLSPRRIRLAEDGTVTWAAAATTDRTAYEIDYDRIVFSSPFRRLARKTQVHPFSEVDHVHNRLTHSLEVSAVCQTLAREAGAFLVARGELPPERVPDLIWTVQAAGLAHDIGNPPYGHSGETAIQAWAEKMGADLGDDPVWRDFRYFDGNAQTFRMMSRPDLREMSYFRLTAATLGALVKYPRRVTELPADYRGPTKLAAFTTEDEIFHRVWEELGLIGTDGTYRRHPLSYLSEAADDICYRIADFEDAVLMGIFPYDVVSSIFLKVLPEEERAANEKAPIQQLRARAIGQLIRAFSEKFKEHYDDILAGTFAGDLRGTLTGPVKEALDEIQQRYEILFSNHRKVIAEIGSYSQFSFILTSYCQFLNNRTAAGMPPYETLPGVQRQLVQLAWGRAYYERCRWASLAWWAHAVLDFVVGMTDDYINTLFHRLGGVGLQNF
jgi:dGTPase